MEQGSWVLLVRAKAYSGEGHMTSEELDAMTTEQMFDWLRLNTDYVCAPVIDRLEERWLLTSSAAKLWFAHASGDIKAEQRRLDRKAVESEHNVG